MQKQQLTLNPYGKPYHSEYGARYPELPGPNQSKARNATKARLAKHDSAEELVEEERVEEERVEEEPQEVPSVEYESAICQ